MPGLTVSPFPEVSIVELAPDRVDNDVDVDDDDDEEDEEEMIPPPPQIKRRRMMESPGCDDDEVDDATHNDDDDADTKSGDDSGKTSRLLTKNDCRGTGGRKRNSGSLIHSIPKFSQV